MSNINDVLPETIKTAEQAKEWLLVHGYSVDVANEELKNWSPAGADAPVEEPAPEPDPEPEVEEEDEEWDEEEDEDWDDEEDEDWDEDDSEEDED